MTFLRQKRFMYKSIFALCLIHFIFIGKFSLAAPNNGVSIRFNGGKFVFPKLKLQDSAVDVSEVVQQIEKAVLLPYEDNLYELDKIQKKITEGSIYDIIFRLCQESGSSSQCVVSAQNQLLQVSRSVRERMEKMFLFPRFYRRIGDRAYLLNEREDEILDCNNCQNYRIIGAVWRGTEEVYSQVYDKIKDKNPVCVEQILGGLFKKIERTRVPVECLKEEYKNHSVCQAIDEDIRVRQNRITELIELFNKDNTLNIEEENLCLSPDVKRYGGINDLYDLVSSVNDEAVCRELNPGEEKIINPFNLLGKPYIVKREQDGSYSISLNMAFTAGENYDGSVPEEQVPEHYMNKVQECLRQANSKMLGPNGEKLNINIQPPENNVCEQAETRQIKIMSENNRSNAGAYAADINCSTITHEVLHLFGLCDEYDEKDRDHYVSSEALEAGEIIKGEEGVFARFLQDLRVLFGDYEFASTYRCRFVDEDSIMSNDKERWEKVFQEGIHSSLLDTRHFNVLLYGNCQEKNKFFHECSQFAYLEVENPQACLEKKRQCTARYNSQE